VRRTTVFPVDWDPSAANLADHILAQELPGDLKTLRIKGFDTTEWGKRPSFTPEQLLQADALVSEILKHGYSSNYDFYRTLDAGVPLDFALNLELSILDAPWTVAELKSKGQTLDVVFAPPGLWNLMNSMSVKAYVSLRRLRIDFNREWRGGGAIP